MVKIPRFGCQGNGYEPLCFGGHGLLKDCRIKNMQGQVITSAFRGETIRLEAKIHGRDWPCGNFYLEYHFGENYIDCYEDRIANGENWWVPIQYTIPENAPPGMYQYLVKETRESIFCYKHFEVLSDCPGYPDQTSCEAHDCYWWNNSCHGRPPNCFELNNYLECIQYGCWWLLGSCWPSACGLVENQAACEEAGCYWWNGTCHSHQPTCINLNNRSDCERYGCEWYNGSCHQYSPTCRDLNNQTDCQRYGCIWFNGQCYSSLECHIFETQQQCEAAGCCWNGACHECTCVDYEQQQICEAHGCYWYNGSCHENAPPCESINNQTDCQRYGCYWYNGSCHSDPQSVECEDYTTQSECETAGCYWYNNSCHSDPQSLECEDYTNQSECENAGCFWYAYPNPLGEPSCHSKPWHEAYLPYMIAGIGGTMFVLAIATPSKKGGKNG